MRQGATGLGTPNGSPEFTASGKLENLTLWERFTGASSRRSSRTGFRRTDLQEAALADSLGVSRGPIRAAIGRLAAGRLVVVRPRRGAVVATLSKTEFLEAYQVREALELLAIRLAAPQLLRALAAGDAERAAHLLSEHIRVPQRRLGATPEEKLFGLAAAR